MQFEERRIGEYRLYAGAIEALRGEGYLAALVIERHPAGTRTHEVVMRDESLACGHRWKTAAEALTYAVQRGRAVIRRETAPMAVC